MARAECTVMGVDGHGRLLERMRPNGGWIATRASSVIRAWVGKRWSAVARAKPTPAGVRVARRRSRPRPIHIVCSLAYQKPERCS
ncbi:hypothetical protein AZ78_3109 [Lysobacter capsici AZ78]|uniref:Uncharacterized protein n=1 Tax=Lysobacter capsici AZ78 TaxID=1444315 RepID=A0A120AH37_9GAMM|nr:hypothetical protein AZ78_3109 [Lysobacter capsici AZ78]